MKKALSLLLTVIMMAALAISAGAGMYTYDPSDDEYWDAALNMLDKEAGVYVWLEDGCAGDYMMAVDIDGNDIFPGTHMDNLKHGWYEAVLCGLGSSIDDFDEAYGKIALVVRGDSTFYVKSSNALEAGAVGAIVLNNCRPEEAVDENGVVTTGSYVLTNMAIDNETLPMCMLSSDMAVKLVATCADVTTKEAVDALAPLANGTSTEFGLEAKKSTYIFYGTEAEYKAAGSPAENAQTAEAPVETVEETVAEPEPAETVEETVEAAAPETTEEVQSEPAPQTSDYTVIALVIAVAAAAGVCALLTRKKRA